MHEQTVEEALKLDRAALTRQQWWQQCRRPALIAFTIAALLGALVVMLNLR